MPNAERLEVLHYPNNILMRPGYVSLRGGQMFSHPQLHPFQRPSTVNTSKRQAAQPGQPHRSTEHCLALPTKEKRKKRKEMCAHLDPTDW